MKPEEFSWQSKTNQKIFAQAWLPAQARGAIALVHGLGEHSARYAHVAQVFNENDLAVVALDLPGHGRSEGIRGHATFSSISDEIDILLAETRQRCGDQPVFLYGHSLGASLTLYYTLKRKPELKGVIVTSPPLATVKVAGAKLFLARVLAKLAPSVTLDNGLIREHLSQDPSVVSAYQQDPLVHPRISAGLGWDMLSTGQWLIDHAVELHLPLLLMHGTGDKICLCSGSQQFAERAPAGKVTLKLWEGLYHETHNEPAKVEVITYTLNWIVQQLGIENGILASAS
jgi:alpha-beta hydrolase superfamily lysophospholipase